MRRELVVGHALALVALALAGAGCGRGEVAAPQAGGAGEDPGLVHVHRLALDPDDPATLYIATHTGLYRSVDGAPPERVGDRYHDLMGFTITAEGRFLASGHPDLRSEELQRADAPPLLGLVESRDEGVRWEPVSLLGETDFHALEAEHGLLYAADSTSGRFMVSTDGVEWETRSTPALQTIAVDPQDPDVIVGGGVPPLRSEDGGRTWEALSSPPIAVIAWSDDTLYAGLPDGRVQSSTDGGDTWQASGSLGGEPEALLAEADLLYAAAVGRGVLRSDDDGETWDVLIALG